VLAVPPLEATSRPRPRLLPLLEETLPVRAALLLEVMPPRLLERILRLAATLLRLETCRPALPVRARALIKLEVQMPLQCPPPRPRTLLLSEAMPTARIKLEALMFRLALPPLAEMC
jgi:hypothetical protein